MALFKRACSIMGRKKGKQQGGFCPYEPFKNRTEIIYTSQEDIERAIDLLWPEDERNNVGALLYVKAVAKILLDNYSYGVQCRRLSSQLGKLGR